MPIAIRVLTSPGCAHGAKTVPLVREVAAELAPDARVEEVVIRTLEEAELHGFPGSPTVLVNGVDVEPGVAGPAGLG